LIENAEKEEDVDKFDESLNAPITAEDRSRERELLAHAREVIRGGAA
jgi:hypothetical protein